MSIDHGTFQIYFHLKDNISLAIGALGFYVLPEGKYIYTGKANRDIYRIVRRLITPYKKVRMHMDFISVLDSFEAKKILIYPGIMDPCVVHEITIKYSLGHTFIPNFGTYADDRCSSHLIYLTTSPDNVFKKLIAAFKGVMLNPEELYA